MTDMAADEAMTRRALELLGSRRNDAYEAALAALREDRPTASHSSSGGFERLKQGSRCGR